MAVTIRDVARTTGVSIKTVSRVLNNQGEISDATRQRVLAAIEELGYRPNGLARGLVSGKTSSIGLIIPQISDPFFPEVVQGVEHVARSRGYSVFLCNTEEDPQQELEYVEVLAAKQVDGIILCGSRLSASQLAQVAAKHPVSILTSRPPQNGAVISIAGEGGICTITSHLISLGHRAIGHIGWQVGEEHERADGYARAFREYSLPVDERRITYMPSVSIEAGQVAARQLLYQAPEITAITCYNDLTAIGALKACAEAGRRVPQDIAVVGFDDIPLASLVTPALTTMRVPRYRLGQMVMDLLLKVIAHRGSYAERLYIQPELVVRESCGAQARLKSESALLERIS